jgi:hypothetical protein
MIQEFKEFISKGNVVMLAVGFIMGVAFQAVVSLPGRECDHADRRHPVRSAEL